MCSFLLLLHLHYVMRPCLWLIKPYPFLIIFSEDSFNAATAKVRVSKCSFGFGAKNAVGPRSRPARLPCRNGTKWTKYYHISTSRLFAYADIQDAETPVEVSFLGDSRLVDGAPRRMPALRAALGSLFAG